jgi:hypothetical protein
MGNLDPRNVDRFLQVCSQVRICGTLCGMSLSVKNLFTAFTFGASSFVHILEVSSESLGHLSCWSVLSEYSWS